MKFDYKKFNEQIKNVFSKKHILYSIDSIWLILLFTILFVTVLLLFWSIFLFINVNVSDVFELSFVENELVETLNRSQLESLLDTIRKRDVEFIDRTSVTIELPVISDSANDMVEDY